jgi:hypothetical protein
VRRPRPALSDRCRLCRHLPAQHHRRLYDRLVCDAPSYATPAVEITPLSAAVPARLASIEAQAPNGGIPSGPALGGAIDQAREWANAHPGHTVTVLLATDGLPTDGAPIDVDALTAIAAAGLKGRPSVRTFAIGVFGSDDFSPPHEPALDHPSPTFRRTRPRRALPTWMPSRVPGARNRHSSSTRVTT